MARGGRALEWGRRVGPGGRLVPASFSFPEDEALAVLRATRVKVALWLRVKAECGGTWPASADAAARAIAAGEDEVVVAELVRRAFPSASSLPPAAACAARAVRRPRVRPPSPAEAAQWAADDAAADDGDLVAAPPSDAGSAGGAAASPLSAAVSAWSTSAEKRQGHGLDPAEVAELWSGVQARKAEGDPRRGKSAEAEAGRMRRVAAWCPPGTIFDGTLSVAAVRAWKSTIVAAAASGNTTPAEARKAVGLLSTLMRWASESRRVAWTLPEADDDGLTWQNALRLPEGYGRGPGPRPWWGSELAAMFGRVRGQWVEAAVLMALNLGATQADFGVILGSDVEEVGGRWLLNYTRAKVKGKSRVRVSYPLWPETVSALKAVGAWGRVGDDVPLLTLPSGNACNKDNVSARHWSPIRQAMEDAGELRPARGQGDNGFRNLRRTGAQRLYVAAPVGSRAELSKAYLQQELIGGSASAYVVGCDSPLFDAVDAAGAAMRGAGVFDGDAERVGAWGREKVGAELSALMTAAAAG